MLARNLVWRLLSVALAPMVTSSAPPPAAQVPASGHQLQATKAVAGYLYVRGLPVFTNSQTGMIIYQPVVQNSSDRLWYPVARDFSDTRLRRIEAEAAAVAAAKAAEETTVKLLPSANPGNKSEAESGSGLKIARQGSVSGVLQPSKQRILVNLVFYAEEEADVKRLCDGWLKQGKQPTQQMLDTALGNATEPPLTVAEAQQMQGNVRGYLQQTVIPALVANHPAARAEFKGLKKQFPDVQGFADEQLKLASARMVEQVARQAQAAGGGGTVIGQTPRTGGSERRIIAQGTSVFYTPACKNCPLRKKKS